MPTGSASIRACPILFYEFLVFQSRAILSQRPASTDACLSSHFDIAVISSNSSFVIGTTDS
ncbi:MAG: hypothetical protein ACRD6X_22140, partial [Pyrinomonadaceae bacterium]